ncbi:hypothetical protein PISL3812_08196 [Talaromyces islandicus]|uniref:Uncharacterized protein n=1 Tax=Talaromyces islandicus TaxID=28573 RepID=A0A0U1M6G4_TALIS|nr:hypothetical protein PISL3812_08196 [Talaromyces islandicus]
MARYHIPGIPLIGPGGLRGLTRASEFVTMPRAPVGFLRNSGPRHLVPSASTSPGRPSAIPPPFARTRHLVPPGAPRRLRFYDAPVSSFPFPRLTPPSPPPPSPLRFTYWETPSLSKQGVRRAYINRRLPTFPSPSRIPLPVPKPLLQGAPRKHVTFAVPVARSFEDALCEPAAPTPCKPRAPRPRLCFDRARAPASPSVRGGSCTRRSASSLRSILVRSADKPVDEVRVKKSVRFGGVAVHDVDYWIDRKRHVFFDGGLWKMGRLQGWRVTTQPNSESDGEEFQGYTMWGHDHSNLNYHTNMPRCHNLGCRWQEIAEVYKQFARQGLQLGDRHDLIMFAWSELREREREKGRWLL